MKDIEKKDKRKIVLSLLIAALFVLSATASLARNVSVDSTVEEEEAGDINTIQMGTIPKSAELYTGQTQIGVGLSARDTVPVRMDDDGCWPVKVEEITVGGHTLPAVISTGTYELCINVSRPEYGEFAPWTSFIDSAQEKTDPLGPMVLQPLLVKTKCTEDFVWIRFVNKGMCGPGLINHEWPIGEVKIRIKGDLGSKTYTTDLGDASGGTKLYHGATQIPGSTVSRSGGFPATTNSVVTIKIPRAVDPASGKQYWSGCCDVIEWYYYVGCSMGTPGLNENKGGWQPDPCDVDMYDAEVKKFIEIYKWHEPITEDDITETIFCEDFEDPCQVTDKWDADDVGPDGDTWVLSTNRFVSAGHSYHNTQHATYMPSAEDYLIFHNGTSGLDVSGMDELKVSFQHWMKGDFVDPNIMDYGWVEYSFTGAFTGEEVFAGGLYYDNDWEEVIFTIDVDPLSAADDNLYLRFGFIADAGFCYEGWYIDDMCVYGTEYGSVTDGYWEFTMDSHSWPQIIEGPYEWYCFPEKWTVTEEGTYKVCAWLEAIDPCHYSMDTFGFTGDLCELVTIGDILELELGCPATITPPSPATEGDDVVLSTQVCNIGTLDATDVQVQMTVNRGTIDTVFFSDVESGPYDNDTFKLVTSYEGTEFWEIEETSANHAWVWANPDGLTYPADIGYDASFPPYGYHSAPLAVGPPTYSAADSALGPMLKFQAKWAFDVGGDGSDFFALGIHDVSMDAFVRYGYHCGMATPTTEDFKGGVQTTWKTVEFSYVALLNALVGWGDGDGDWQLAFGVYTRQTSDGDSGESFSGIIADDFEIIQMVSEPDVIWTQTVNIPFLNITDCEPVAFTWPDAGVGQYIVTTEIVSPTDEDDSNNKCVQAHNVINIECDIADCGKVTFVDHTGGPSHWMVEGCCGGYFWCGDPVTTTYGINWSDCLYLLSNPSRTFDCSGYTNVDVEFDAAYKTNTSDLLYIEASADNGSAWWIIGSIVGTNPSWPGFDFYTIDVDVMLSGYGVVLTDKMQFRFRFESNATEVNRGVYLDNIGITGASYIFGPDDCTTMDNFEHEGTQYGNWWRTPHQLVYAYGLLIRRDWHGDPITDAQTYGCYDPLAYSSQPRPWNDAVPDNIDNSLDWTLTLPNAFYGYIQTGPITGCGDGPGGNEDVMALQISDDGSTFDTLMDMVDNCAYWYPAPMFDVTDYLNSDVTIRYRMTTDGFTPWFGDGFMFEGMTFYGMEDPNAPVTTCVLTGDIDPVYLYYTDRVKVTLTATDDITGVKETWYELDGGAAQLYDGPFMVRDDGEHIVCYWSVDNEDNVETKKCTIPFKIDQTGPSVTITAPELGLYLFGNKLLDIEKSIHLFGGVQVAATVTTDDAPLKVVEFYMNDVLFAQDVTAPFEIFCTEKNSGSATFKVVAIDVLDQSSEASITVDTYIKIL